MTTRVENSRMNIFRLPADLQRSERCLGVQEIEYLDGMRTGESILCTNGILWFTQEGASEDYLLRKGESCIVIRPGLVLVQALNDSACWRRLND